MVVSGRNSRTLGTCLGSISPLHLQQYPDRGSRKGAKDARINKEVGGKYSHRGHGQDYRARGAIRASQTRYRSSAGRQSPPRGDLRADRGREPTRCLRPET